MSRLVLSLAALVFAGRVDAQITVPGSSVTFEIDSTSARVGDHLGRRAVFIRGQSPPVFFGGADFTEGTVEFDLSRIPNADGQFAGLVFHYLDGFHHENVYFRLHRSGSFEAVQYAPRVNSAAGNWQLYPEFLRTAWFPSDGWVHVRAEIRARGLELFVGDSAGPLLVVPRLRGVTASGRIGVWGRVNNKPAEWTAAISNVHVRPRVSTQAMIPAPVDTVSVPNGMLTGWQVAGPFEAPDDTVLPPLPTSWEPFPLEENGLLNITRRLRKPRSGRHVAFLRNTIRAERAGVAELELGYSDDVVVLLNGARVFSGRNGFESRYPGFLGLIAPEAERVVLPLRAGTNVLVLAVGERTFGWGVKARLIRSSK